jgi:type II secretory pathway pseudopilin PulG
MTLIEVLVSIVILGGALLSMGAFIGRFSHTTKTIAFQQRGIDLATDRIDAVKHAPTYVAIDSMGTLETINADSTSYTRQTTIKRMGGSPGDTVDFKIVTVRVTQPALTNAVSKTTYISVF